MCRFFFILLLMLSTLLGGIARAEPLVMPGPARREAPLSTISASEMILVMAAAVGVGALAVPAASDVLLTVAGTLILVEIGLLILEVGAIAGIIYIWPEDETERLQLK